MDYSTLNLEELETMPVTQLSPGNYIDTRMGNGCFLDAPGYPTYFTQCIYTSTGNYPNGVEYLVIGDSSGTPHTVSRDYPRKDLRSLWVPLPIEHERVQTWIAVCYSYFANCYANPAMGDEWRNVSHCLIDANHELPPEHHLAVLHIQEFYPEHIPDLEAINHPTKAYGSSGDWWERG